MRFDAKTRGYVRVEMQKYAPFALKRVLGYIVADNRFFLGLFFSLFCGGISSKDTFYIFTGKITKKDESN